MTKEEAQRRIDEFDTEVELLIGRMVTGEDILGRLDLYSHAIARLMRRSAITAMQSGQYSREQALERTERFLVALGDATRKFVGEGSLT